MARDANYSRPIYLAWKVLTESNIETFPVSLKLILRHYGIRLMSYDKFSHLNDCPIEDCYRLFGKDGATISDNGKFLIVFNDAQSPKDRIRFTLAHELGHIFHGHHKELGVDVLQRMWVEKTLYDVMEDEANCFARNLLCPPIASQKLLRLHGFVACEFNESKKRNVWLKVHTAPSYPGIPAYVTDSFLLRQAFKITDKAAETRCHFLKSDLSSIYPKDRNITSPIHFNARWRCEKCGAPRIDFGKHCFNCGRHHFVFSVKDDAPPDPVSLRYRGIHFRSCPFCGNSDLPEDAIYCTICGKLVTNTCIPHKYEKWSYAKYLSNIKKGLFHQCYPGTRHCISCGAITLFGIDYSYASEDLFEYRGGIQNAYNEEGGIPAVDYGPNIPYDPNTFKVSKCPKCLYSKHDDDALFCIMCGTDLYNKCEGYYTPETDELITHPNPPNARFCHTCGRPTAYAKLGFLPSYKDILAAEKGAAEQEISEMKIDEKLFWEMNEVTENSSTADINAAADDTDELPF